MREACETDAHSGTQSGRDGEQFSDRARKVEKRERERESALECVCVCECVSELEIEREREREVGAGESVIEKERAHTSK